ncbi:MAG: imidazolonepropionase [Bacteroidetes bacterium]|nr:imidazolonepropionase [Bacteroidota bacterium]
MLTLYSNIKQLVQIENNSEQKNSVKGKEMDILPCMDNAWLLIENDRIKDFGSMHSFPVGLSFDQEINCTGKYILPTWCDSHTHLVFSHAREHEFVDRIHGMSYEEIAKRGGGILNSAKRMQEISESELFDISLQRLHQVMDMGTGAIEIKSGYGLSTEGELKMLRVIRKLKDQNLIDIKASFLAAHAFPLEYKENHEGYIKLIIEEMLPKVVDEGLADYMDVFCEKGFFNVDETDRLLSAAAKYGLKPKIHANQLYNSGGVQIGVKHHAISVDHLETMDDEEVACLQNSNTMATLLPGAAFFLAIHYQPARKLIDAGLPVALATDFNPGSCPSGNMNFILSLACTQMRMTPEEAVNACTLNGAAAMELQHQLGTIARGKKARFIITKPMSSLAYLPYAFGERVIERVVI